MTRFGRLDFFIEMKTFIASIVEKYHGNSEAKSKHFQLLAHKMHFMDTEHKNMPYISIAYASLIFALSKQHFEKEFANIFFPNFDSVQCIH